MSALPQTMQETQPPEAADNDLVSSEVQEALRLLQTSNAYAEDVGQDVWQFASDISQLRKLGLSDSAMRWLLCRGEILHADETTMLGDSRRTFRSLGIFTLTPTTCFIAKPTNYSGQQFSSCNGQISYEPAQRRGASDTPKLTPVWDDIRHELLFGQYVVKRFKHKSRNQEAILATFQEDGWPYRVYDPLSPVADCDPKRRLNDTIKGLNHHQENALIRFRGDGTGEAVIWELTQGCRSNPTLFEGLFR
jgi:hypothetical protein